MYYLGMLLSIDDNMKCSNEDRPLFNLLETFSMDKTKVDAEIMASFLVHRVRLILRTCR
jgi:hypothetical protein